MATRNPLIFFNRRCGFPHVYQYQHSATASKQVPAAQYLSCSYIKRVSQRNMGSTARAKNEYMVIIPDKDGALQKRIEVRGAHLANLKPVLDSGFLKLGGAMLESHPEEGETPQMKGSMLLVVSESPEAIREQLSKDIYATSGVWDIDNFKSAIRLPL
ncbi:hypothetical protein ACJ72_05089 [Emergomyces africanus]|uniref:YCII-related domain-containing protein n=1 Tax=Emergomyces africanus TaxID=1955775 RepID=A0A1B7NV98_9EURO|nr:hypothetical protein ACJ72_05089 [Emergomyces africanus]